MFLDHQGGQGLHVLLGPHGENLFGHHVLRRRPRRVLDALLEMGLGLEGDAAIQERQEVRRLDPRVEEDQVEVRDHADDLPVDVDDGQAADRLLVHQARDATHRGGGRHRDHVHGHDVLHPGHHGFRPGQLSGRLGAHGQGLGGHGDVSVHECEAAAAARVMPTG